MTVPDRPARDDLPPRTGTRRRCPCGSADLRLRVPIHAMVEINEHEWALEIDSTSAGQRLEAEAWQGFCQKCGRIIVAARVPADDVGRALYAAIQDAVKDVGDRIAGGVEAYVDLDGPSV